MIIKCVGVLVRFLMLLLLLVWWLLHVWCLSVRNLIDAAYSRNFLVSGSSSVIIGVTKRGSTRKICEIWKWSESYMSYCIIMSDTLFYHLSSYRVNTYEFWDSLNFQCCQLCWVILFTRNITAVLDDDAFSIKINVCKCGVSHIWIGSQLLW